MAKHRFHTLDECPAHIEWMMGRPDTYCYLRYVFTFPGTVEAYYANHDYVINNKHSRME